MTGGAYGIVAASVFPDLASSGTVYVILGMGAVAAAVLGAPVSTTVMVFELTGGYTMSIALLLTVSIASAGARALVGGSFFHRQLAARGVRSTERAISARRRGSCSGGRACGSARRAGRSSRGVSR